MSEDFLKEPKIAVWKKSIADNGCTINTLKPLSVYMRNPEGQLLFALLKADITTPEGNTIPPVIFVRGHACIIVVQLTNKDTKEKRFLMVRQRRIATGAHTLEFPAGMLDREINTPRKVAIKELKEETGLEISEDMLQSLADAPLYTSPGASDEAIYFYGCCIELDSIKYDLFEGRTMDDTSENEHIQVTLKSKKQALKEITTLPARLALTLFEEHFKNHS